MKNLKIVFVVSFLISFVLWALPFNYAHAQVIVFEMIKAEKTGNKRQAVAPRSNGEDPLTWYYEIEVEWQLLHYTSSSAPTNLLRNNNIIAWDVSCSEPERYWDSLANDWRYNHYYCYYDWPSEGTYCYKAKLGSVYTGNQSCETVP